MERINELRHLVQNQNQHNKKHWIIFVIDNTETL
jgi:hypothetical protein